jgi:hypothetical protein
MSTGDSGGKALLAVAGFVVVAVAVWLVWSWYQPQSHRPAATQQRTEEAERAERQRQAERVKGMFQGTEEKNR